VEACEDTVIWSGFGAGDDGQSFVPAP
jgi:hypothetical protein